MSLFHHAGVCDPVRLTARILKSSCYNYLTRTRYIRARLERRTHANAQVRGHTRTHTHTPARTRARAHSHTHTHTHVCAHSHTHTHTRARAFTRTHTRTRAHARTHARTHTHTHARAARAHTHTHTYVISGHQAVLKSYLMNPRLRPFKIYCCMPHFLFFSRTHFPSQIHMSSPQICLLSLGDLSVCAF